MTDIPEIQGVPRALARDAWWLGIPPSDGPKDRLPKGLRGSGLWVIGFTILADLLFWEQGFGLSLVICAVALVALAMCGTTNKRAKWYAALWITLGALPVVEHMQALSVGFLVAGLAAALAVLRVSGPPSFWSHLAGLIALVKSLPFVGWVAARAYRNAPFTHRHLIRNWAFPAGGALVLVALLVEANPVLESAIRSMLDLGNPAELDWWDVTLRPLFWVGMAVMALGVMNPPATPARPVHRPRLDLPGFGLNAISARNALWTFNALLAVQTTMDVGILLGGAALPDGLSYASYAHRGAYPLLVTALLAGGFALATRPFQAEHKTFRPLLMLWLAQNILICGSAALRLDLYIAVYGLTYLRLYALIWMAVTAAALILVAVQILKAHSIKWAVLRLAVLGAATLYVACFVHFAAVITSTNFRLAARATAPVVLDTQYQCQLGPMAPQALVDGLALLSNKHLSSALSGCAITPQLSSWQEWGFRKARMTQYASDMKPGLTQ